MVLVIVRLAALSLALMTCVLAGVVPAPLLGNWQVVTNYPKAGCKVIVKQTKQNTFEVTECSKPPHTSVADGKLVADPALKRDTSLSILPDGGWQWLHVYKSGRRQTNKWRVEDQGRLLIIDGHSVDPAAKEDFEWSYQFKREGTGTGVSGTWSFYKKVRDTLKPFELVISPYRGNGISINSTDGAMRQDLQLDGKFYPDFSKAALKDTVSSMKPIDSRTWEMKNKTGGKLTDTQVWKLSRDNNEMTITTTFVNGEKPEMASFVRVK